MAEIERVAIDSLVEDSKNARTHSTKNLSAIKASLTKFGQQKPIVIDASNVVVAGNGTMVAARSLGWDELDVVRTELSDDEAKAFAIADNRTAELADWDDEVLAETLLGLDEELRIATGFAAREIDKLDEAVKDSEIPEEGETMFSEELGEHHNYIMLIFDNDTDWKAAKSHFNLEPKYATRANGEAWNRGTGRVIDGGEYLDDTLTPYDNG